MEENIILMNVSFLRVLNYDILDEIPRNSLYRGAELISASKIYILNYDIIEIQ